MAVRMTVLMARLMALLFGNAVEGRHRPIIARRRGPSVHPVGRGVSVGEPLHTRELGAPG